MYRLWVRYDGGETQEREIARIARVNGGRFVATTADTCVIDVDRRWWLELEDAFEDAGFPVVDVELA